MNLNIINLILIILMVACGLWTVLTRTVLRAAIGLALTSVFLTLLMFRLNSPLAAVFELSICVGLITVIFISTISLTKHQVYSDMLKRMKGRMKRYWYLPVIMVAILVALFFVAPSFDVVKTTETLGVRATLWQTRQLELIGQIAILLAGVFGIVILFKEEGNDK